MKLLLVAALAACQSCAYHKPQSLPQLYETRGVERIVKSSVRIRVYCNGQLTAYGSGVAVSPRHVLSARHIARGCSNSPTPDMAQFEMITPDGIGHEFILELEAANPEIDAARFVILGSLELANYASIADYQPRIGQPVYQYAGDGTMDIGGEHAFQFKQGFVSETQQDLVIVSIHGVPGNSGSGIFDSEGNLLGILWGGSWQYSRENYIEATRPVAWPELVPGPVL